MKRKVLQAPAASGGPAGAKEIGNSGKGGIEFLG
jgi:hypothetical protein